MKAPLLVAEQLALEQRLRQRRAVDRDEGGVRPRARAVDRPRRELLAGAALAEDQDRRLGPGHARDELVHPTDGRALADHFGAGRPFRAQPLPFALEPLEVPDVLEGAGGDVRQAHQELEVGLRDPEFRAAGVQVQHAEERLLDRDRHRDERPNGRRDETVGRPERTGLAQVVRIDRLPIAPDLGEDGPADRQGLAPARDPILLGRRMEALPLVGNEQGATLGGNGLEGEIDEGSAEVRHGAGRGDPAARREKDLQVLADPALRRRGERRADAIRLEVERLGRREADRRAHPDVVQIEPAVGRPVVRVAVAEQEEEPGGADLDLVAVFEPAAHGGHAVDERSVGALAVRDLVRISRSRQNGMTAGGLGVGDGKRIGQIASDRDLVGLEPIHGTLQRTRHGHESRLHGTHLDSCFLSCGINRRLPSGPATVESYPNG